jgi:serine/threonine protein kinase
MSPERDRRVYALFDETLRCDPAGRRALLEERCAGDPELRTEVERLLAWDDEAEREGFLESSNPTVSSALGPRSVRGGTRRLGRFELIEAVGSGAFGTVYKARDPQLDRTVAIKVPRAGSLTTEEDRDRFLREARSVARLRHAAIVPVHEVGEDDEVPFLVSNFVQGVTLAELLTARRPSPHEAARLAAEVADALQYAHEQGVVHRDVKPSNILLDDAGRPHLTDFGLARRDAGEVTMTI